LSPKELIRAAEREGWAATLCPGGHWKLEHPDASAPLFFANTPSDHRWAENTLAIMRRVLPREPQAARVARPRPERRPPPTHRPEPVRAWPEPIAMFKLPEPERRVYPPLEPRRPRLAGGPAGYRSCLDR
jgi:hypothetical protein